MRIAIIGCGGSGKTYLASQLAEHLKAPLTHLDAVYYDSDWNPLGQTEFAALQEDLVTAPTWVIEGNYAGTLPIRLAASDVVVFLDLPATVCLWGILQRRARHGGGQDARTGVYDRITFGFIKYVWGYRRTMAPRVRALIAEHAGHAIVHTVTTRRQARALLTNLTSTEGP
ncbi:topology modulation protein [Streptomyces sp. NPDC056549]|uniref:topology modulation protein n=1 Tax=Streptomyces sp. NPDC056549 TaxID=3345864 RepID=UPI0036A063B2